jgi:hypothetical protein
LLRKNLTIDFVKNVQKKQEYGGLYYGISNDEVWTKSTGRRDCSSAIHCAFIGVKTAGWARRPKTHRQDVYLPMAAPKATRACATAKKKLRQKHLSKKFVRD